MKRLSKGFQFVIRSEPPPRVSEGEAGVSRRSSQRDDEEFIRRILDGSQRCGGDRRIIRKKIGGV